MLYGVIIAGGMGKRLWPKSRTSNPKFFLRIKGKRSLLQEAVARAREFIPLKNIIVVTNRAYAKSVRRQLSSLPAKNIVVEPVSRNTAAAICVSAFLIKKRDPNGVIIVMPADQVIEEPLL